MYVPDRWVIVGFNHGDGRVVYKILTGMYGGYTGSDEWRLSSGLVDIKTIEHDKAIEIEDKESDMLKDYGISEDGDDNGYYLMKNVSGSIYKCYKACEGFSMLTSGMFKSFEDKLKSIGATISVVSVEEFEKLGK